MNLDPKIIDLVIERSTYGLSSADEQQLDRLILSSLNPKEVLSEIERFELSLAAMELAEIGLTESGQTPRATNAVIHADLQQEIRQQSFDTIEQNRLTARPKAVTADASRARSSGHRRYRRFAVREIVAWSVAAASLLTLAFFIRQSPDPEQMVTELPAVPTMKSGDDLADDLALTDQQMKQFLGSTPEDLLTLSWTPVDNKNVTGKVFWSDQQQTGYMTFSGMEVNDPRQQQYQVWIYDSNTQEQTPVNGGVFDVGKSGHHVIPIAPKSLVKKAVQFAITTEQPGGVTVSKRKHIPTVASKPF